MVEEREPEAAAPAAPKEAGTTEQSSAPQKHSLEHKWTLWFDNPKGSTRQASWGQTLRAVYSFDTVEDFWWYAAELDARSILALFMRMTTPRVGSWKRIYTRI